MIGKVIKSGRSFKGCVQYCVNKQAATILHADGVRCKNARQAIADFNMQRKLNPNLGQAVGHIALAFSPNDTPTLTDSRLVMIAQQYLERMKIGDTQLLMVKHNDTKHPHLHIIYNRVNNQGKTISDSMLRERNVRVAKALTLEQGLYMSNGKQQVNRQRLKGAELVKYQIYDAIQMACRTVKNIDELKLALKKQGINMEYKYRSGTSEVQGVSFSKAEYKFKGSDIDRSMSFGKLSQSIAERITNEQQRQTVPSLAEQLRAAIKGNERTGPAIGQVNVTLGRSAFETLLKQPAAGAQQTQDDALLYRKKKKKGKSQGNYLSR